MKITAYLVTYGRPVGADRMSGVLLRALAARGHDVQVFADLDGGSYEDEGVKVTPRLYMKPTHHPGDVIYAHADYGSLPFLMRQKTGARLVYAVHNASPMTEHSLTHFPPDLVAWNAQSTAERLRGWLTGETREVLVRPPLTVPARPAPRKDAKAVAIGNVTTDKGSETFYELAARFPDVPFLGVVGGYGEHDHRPELAEIMEPVPQAQMRSALWARTRVLVAPSRFESWGMVTAEAMAHGVPVIASDVPGFRESIGDGGRFAVWDDLPVWESHLRELLTDADAYKRAAAYGRARAAHLSALHRTDLAGFLEAVESL